MPIATAYRFFELHDLANVSKSEFLIYVAKGKRVRLTPPPKAYLEEKLWFALFHHPSLQAYWEDNLPDGGYDLLRRALPKTWIVDPAPLPPQAVIPGLEIDGWPLQDWQHLGAAGKRDRRLVLKPSGFSELSWGSRGVVIGHDQSASDWAAAVASALSGYPRPSWVLQEYRPPSRRTLNAYDVETTSVLALEGRARLTPFYFVRNGVAELSTVLATICPSDKKKVHGMDDAVMTVCSCPAQPRAG